MANTVADDQKGEQMVMVVEEETSHDRNLLPQCLEGSGMVVEDRGKEGGGTAHVTKDSVAVWLCSEHSDI